MLECSVVIEIYNGIMFEFYLGLSMCRELFMLRDCDKQSSSVSLPCPTSTVGLKLISSLRTRVRKNGRLE